MMKEDDEGRMRVLDGLRRALEAWDSRGNEQAMTRWLHRELGDHGAPLRLAIRDWPHCLEQIAAARDRAGGWPEAWSAPVECFIRATLQFARPDGTLATDFESGEPGTYSVTGLGERLSGPSIKSSARRLSPSLVAGSNGQSPAPPALWAEKSRVLGVLRASGRGSDDFLVIDHRSPTNACRLELFGGGRSWLGPYWQAQVEGEASRPRPLARLTIPGGEFAEWSYRAGPVRVTHSVVLFPGRCMALLSLLLESNSALPAGRALEISLAPRVAAEPAEKSRALVLSEPRKTGSALVMPIGLPCLPYATDRGAFGATAAGLVLSQAAVGRRLWLPLLVTWDGNRRRKQVHWRALTVSEQSRVVAADRAFAARVSWGRGESYVVYRSLALPAARAFLGHHTRARFLFGLFTPDGTVTPIVKID